MSGSGPRKGPLPEWNSTSDQNASIYYAKNPQDKKHGDLIIIPIYDGYKSVYVVNIQDTEYKFLQLESKYITHRIYIIPLEITSTIEDPIKFYSKSGNFLCIELDPYKHRESLFNHAERDLTPHPAVKKFTYYPNNCMWLYAHVSIENNIIQYKVPISTEGNFSEKIDAFISKYDCK